MGGSQQLRPSPPSPASLSSPTNPCSSPPSAPTPFRWAISCSAPPRRPPAAPRATAARSRRPRSPSSFDLAPIALPLGGKQPATLDGHFDATGYTLHLTGSALLTRLLALGDAIPQLGDGLRPLLEPAPADANPAQPQKPTPEADPIHLDLTDPSLDLTATRAWGGPQTWSQTTPPPAHPRHRTGD